MNIVHLLRLSVCLTCLFCYQFVDAQDVINKKIQQKISQIQSAESYTPLEMATEDLKHRIPEAILSQKQLFQTRPKQIHSIKNNNSEHLRISIPVNGQTLELQLIKAEILKGDFKVVAASNPDIALDIDTGVHYWGTVEGQANSLAVLSFFNDEIVGAINFNQEQYTIGKVKESDHHILYKNSDLNYTPDFDCEVIPVNNTDAIKTTPVEKSGVADCVRVHIEADYGLYINKGANIQTTINYVNGVFAQVAIMYANESIDTGISYIKVWDIPSPYQVDSELDDLRAQGYGRAHGDIVHLLHNNSGGGVAYLTVLCNSAYNVGVSGVFGSFNNVPAYSWDVNVITHEIGHNLGSPHTHACAWNGNNTQIDDCGNKYFEEDGEASTDPNSCYDANNEILPSSGTIMSYCHIYNSIGVNLNNGFGTQPGDLIRSRVNSASCLIACSTGPTCTDGQQNGNETGIDCGGPDCSACPTCTDGVLNGNETGVDCGGSDCAACVCTGNLSLFIVINTDAYAEETTWRITDGTGNITYAIGGPYPHGVQTILETPCLPPGCYNFSIYDSYGDGLYDGNNTGDYTVVDEYGNTLVSGVGNFGSQETTNFCLQNPCSDVELTFHFDESPGEVSWYMIDDTGNNVGIGGPYTTQGDNTVLTETLCLLDGCYYLLVSDSGGNGMCPPSTNIFNIPSGGGIGGVRDKNTPEVSVFSTGITAADEVYTDNTTLCGNYTIRDANDGLVTSGGGNFGGSQTRNFCLSGGLSETKQAQLKIFDINGAAVQQQNLNADTNNAQVNVRDLPSGMYFVQLVSEGVMMTEKFIKQ